MYQIFFWSRLWYINLLQFPWKSGRVESFLFWLASVSSISTLKLEEASKQVLINYDEPTNIVNTNVE